MRSQMRHPDSRGNQKTTVVYHLEQILTPGVFTPTNPFISGLQSPSRCAKRQATQPSMCRAFDQVPYLSPAQRPTAEIVMSVHNCVPENRKFSVATVDRHDFYPAQFDKQTVNLCHFDRNILGFQCLEQRGLGDSRWQLNLTIPMQPEQRNPAAHCLRLAVSPCPVKPLTDLHRKPVSRNVRLRFHHRLNTVENGRVKIFSANFHAATLSSPSPCVQKKRYGTW